MLLRVGAMALPLFFSASAGCNCAAGKTGPNVGGDGGAEDCDPPCRDEEICRNRECVDPGEDRDGDGYPAIDDCDDEDPEVNPDASEICDGVDNDCSGRADEPFDNDRDGYTTCGGGDPSLRDCNDRDPAVHPGAPERCNGADDDCDSDVDEDDGEIVLCPGGGFCIDGVCDYDCPEGFVDRDGNLENGCECESDLSPDVGDSCGNAVDQGELWDDGGGEVREYVGIVAPADREVWYRFRAQDGPDDDCDSFHVRVQFLENPGGQFVADVYRDDPSDEVLLCDEPALCDEGDTDFEWYTDFQAAGAPVGECPCSLGNQPGMQICNDDTTDFAIRIRRVDPRAEATCDEYRIEISNGVY